jgi:hypothetical protein
MGRQRSEKTQAPRAPGDRVTIDWTTVHEPQRVPVTSSGSAPLAAPTSKSCPPRLLNLWLSRIWGPVMSNGMDTITWCGSPCPPSGARARGSTNVEGDFSRLSAGATLAMSIFHRFGAGGFVRVARLTPRLGPGPLRDPRREKRPPKRALPSPGAGDASISSRPRGEENHKQNSWAAFEPRVSACGPVNA